jgi:hypothetical protein
MDNETRKILSQMVTALKSMMKAMEKSYHMGMYEGTGDISVRNYSKLHKRIAGLLPDDFYITDVLTLELPSDLDDEQKLGHVRMATDQLMDYVQTLLRPEIDEDGESIDVDDIGRDLKDHILVVTKKAIKRAMRNFDVEIIEKDDLDESVEDV